MLKKLKPTLINLFIPICLIILLQSCSKPEQYQDIQNLSIFNQAEITQIIQFQKEFEEEICKANNLSKTDLQECYMRFYKRQREKANSKKVNKYQGQEFYVALLEILDEDLKNDFFENGIKIFDRRIPNSNHAQKFTDTINCIRVNPNGRFFKYVKTVLVDQNIHIKKYFDDFNEIGDFSPLSYSGWMLKYDQLDYKDDSFRLFLIIHYLSTVDEYVKTEASKKELLDDISKAFEERRNKEEAPIK